MESELLHGDGICVPSIFLTYIDDIRMIYHHMIDSIVKHAYRMRHPNKFEKFKPLIYVALMTPRDLVTRIFWGCYEI